VGASGREGASRWFCGVGAALVEEVAKRRLARKRRLAAERWLVARAGADGEPQACCEAIANGGVILAGGSAAKARRRRKRRWRRAKIGGEADAGSEAGVVGAEAGVKAGGCCSEAGLELKRMLVLMQLLVSGQATSQKSDDACP
jgi:hypothetical protein